MNRLISRKMVLLSVLILSVLTSASCWDRIEMDTLTIVTGICLDKAENGEIKITMQVGEVESESGGQSEKKTANSSFYMVSSTGGTLHSCVTKIQEQNNGELFLSQNQIVIISSELAAGGIDNYMDYFLRDRDYRLDQFLLISEGNAVDILKEEVEKGEIPALTLTDMIKIRKAVSKSLTVNVREFIDGYFDESTAPVIPIIKTEKDGEKTKFIFDGMGVIKDGKLIGKLDQDQTDGYQWIMGTMRKTDLDIVTADGKISILVTGENLKTSVVLNDDNGVSVYLDIEAMLNIEEITGFKGAKLKDIVDIIQEEAPTLINGYISDCFSQSISLNADVFEFGHKIHHQHKKRWKEIKDSWDEIYPKTRLYSSVKVKVTESGSAGNSLDMEQ